MNTPKMSRITGSLSQTQSKVCPSNDCTDDVDEFYVPNYDRFTTTRFYDSPKRWLPNIWLSSSTLSTLLGHQSITNPMIAIDLVDAVG